MILELQAVRMSLGRSLVLDGVDLQLEPGEIRLLVGSSGAGKTTLLRLVAGLDAPDSGRILREGRLVSAPGEIRVAPHARRIGLAFQENALWPHLSARAHLSFGHGHGRSRRVPAEEPDALLELVGLSGRGDARPGQLSGGEGQRLSIARALAGAPRLVLLDEPLAHIDLRGRRRLAQRLVDFFHERSIATLWVTHHPEELSFVDGSASLLSGGKLEGPLTPAEMLRLLEERG